MSTDKMCMRKHFLHRRHCTNESLRKMKYKKVRVRVNTANLPVLRPDVVSSYICGIVRRLIYTKLKKM